MVSNLYFLNYLLKVSNRFSFILKLVPLMALVALTSCSDDGWVNNPGDAIFYVTYDQGCGPITIYVDGKERGKLTKFYSGFSSITCGNSAGLTVNLSAGTHKFRASCTGETWPEQDIQITKDGCLRVEL